MKIINSSLLAAAIMMASGASYAANLNDVHAANKRKDSAAQQSQQRIDKLADQTNSLEEDYRQTSNLVSDLKVYNRKLEIQIGKQEQRMQEIDQAIAEVQVMQRQVLPLVERMINALEQFIALDMPFHMQEREERVAFLRKNLTDPNMSVAEKYRQVLEAYKIENEYGRKIDSYSQSLTIDGVEREVTVFRVGRIALLYQTHDLEKVGYWDQRSRSWQPLDNSQYRDAVRNGIRIANNQASINILELPIPAPEAK